MKPAALLIDLAVSCFLIIIWPQPEHVDRVVIDQRRLYTNIQYTTL